MSGAGDDIGPVKLSYPKIRLLEATGFRSFPAATTRYDGTWAIRLTAGHPAKRLNSVNPLDPADCLDIDARIALAEQRFKGFGRPLVFRITPLAPDLLVDQLRSDGWSPFEESVVMEAELSGMDFSAVEDLLPLRDTGRWVEAHIALSGDGAPSKPGMVEIIEATEPETGLFMRQSGPGGKTISIVRCVRDLRFCGIFDLATDPGARRSGHGRSILLSALKWARQKGVRKAWLQVVAENRPAVSLYGSLGFQEVYRYSYWRPPAEVPHSREGGNE